jgi:hypothetical protein
LNPIAYLKKYSTFFRQSNYFECIADTIQLNYFSFSKEQINKYFLNLMSQNRKRTLEQANIANTEKLPNGNAIANNGSESPSDSGPVSKRSLIHNNSNEGRNNAVIAKQGLKQSVVQRPSQKSNKPMQAINQPGLPEEFLFRSVQNIK